jgi:hypothetical protein
MKSFFERWPKPPLDNRSAAQASGNEAEMGAFNFLQQPQRRANLTTALDADPAVHVYRFRATFIRPACSQLRRRDQHQRLKGVFTRVTFVREKH